MHETPEGFLVCVGVPIARTGEMIYGDGETPLDTDDEGKVIITRDEKDVFNPKTMASFEGKPVTITHPSEFVTPENWARLAKGVVQNVRRGVGDSKNDLIADLLITDSVAINLIKNGLREVSCGYEASYSQDDEGEGKQTRIIGNHLALVDQGRAGSSYAINDHKRGGIKKMTLREKIKSIFAKAQDEAMKMAEDESGEKKDESKEESKDAASYDELVKICKDMLSKLDSLGASHDEKEEPKKDDSKDDSKDDDKEDKKDGASDEEVAPSVEDRLKALEASVSKMLEGMSKDADEEEMNDEDMDESEDEMPESTMASDTISRIEILAPGMKSTGKDAKAKALKSAYGTKEGKKVIDSLSSGKPTFDSDSLFIAASEVLKASRTSDLSKTKQGSSTQDNESKPAYKTAEEINELNANFYKRA